MALERYVWSGTSRLRCGYTTGSCAAMAAQAAACLLLDGKAPSTVRLVTPAGVAVEADVLEPAHVVWQGAEAASCAVQKDAGDDPDATDGLRIYARVSRSEQPGVRIAGGPGIGRVTLPGLDQSVGEWAINSVPRSMIEREVRTVFEARGEQVAALVEISAPGGESVAEKTFNPQLGIEGGISILGTSGIVRPMSSEALVASIDLEISQHSALGDRSLVLVPGNYGARFAAGLPELEGLPVVRFSNFLGDALDSCSRHGIGRVLVVGHAGKMVKVASGVMQTHSRVADCRRETFCAHAAICGASPEVARAIMASATTEACLDILEGAGLLKPVMESVMAAIEEHLERRAAGSFEVGALVFSNERGELARTAGADELINAMRKEANG